MDVIGRVEPGAETEGDAGGPSRGQGVRSDQNPVKNNCLLDAGIHQHDGVVCYAELSLTGFHDRLLVIGLTKYFHTFRTLT